MHVYQTLLSKHELETPHEIKRIFSPRPKGMKCLGVWKLSKIKCIESSSRRLIKSIVEDSITKMERITGKSIRSSPILLFEIFFLPLSRFKPTYLAARTTVFMRSSSVRFFFFMFVLSSNGEPSVGVV